MQARTGSDETRASILRAAQDLFHRYGYRKTSVEQIAAAAGVAKPTIYAYFANKEALFVSVAEAVLAEMLRRAEKASRGRGRLEARVAAMLSAKFTYFFEVVQSSPHAAELLGSQVALTRDAEAATDAAYRALVIETLEAAAEGGELELRRVGAADALARLLMQGAYGASYGAETAAQHRANVRRITAALLRAGSG